MILVLSNDNYITVLDSLADAERQSESEHFSSLEELNEVAANWPASRLIEIWNNLPGTTPVKKFTDRKTAVARIWKALEALNGSTPAEAEQPEPETATASDEAAAGMEETELPIAAAEETAASAPQAGDVEPLEAGSGNETTSPKPARTGAPRGGSKADIILALLKRDGGVSLQELMDATGWQKHSVRGFLAGTVNKKMELNLTSQKDQKGERRYSIPA